MFVLFIALKMHKLLLTVRVSVYLVCIASCVCVCVSAEVGLLQWVRWRVVWPLTSLLLLFLFLLLETDRFLEDPSVDAEERKQHKLLSACWRIVRMNARVTRTEQNRTHYSAQTQTTSVCYSSEMRLLLISRDLISPSLFIWRDLIVKIVRNALSKKT